MKYGQAYDDLAKRRSRLCLKRLLVSGENEVYKLNANLGLHVRGGCERID